MLENQEKSNMYIKLADEAAAALKNTSPGPWGILSDVHADSDVINSPTNDVCRTFNTDSGLCRDSSFICWSRTGVQRLEQAVRELVRERDFHMKESASWFDVTVKHSASLLESRTEANRWKIACIEAPKEVERLRSLIESEIKNSSSMIDKAVTYQAERDEARAEVLQLKGETASLQTELKYRVRDLDDARAEIENLKVPYCLGETTIRTVANEGQLVLDSGHAFIAASDLFKKDPYAEVERLAEALKWYSGAEKLGLIGKPDQPPEGDQPGPACY